MQAKIYITLKNGVLDPQGKAIANALGHLGFDGVGDVRQGKLIEVKLEETDPKKAEEAGIPRWLQVLDPGIGFAKDLEHNLSLMKNMNDIREVVNNCPMLLGPSRKGFIGKITGEERAENRDFGTLAACLHVLHDRYGKKLGGPTILRVHNVKGVKQGVQIYEAILKAK